MRIVQVIHGFPPDNMAGSEVYTYNLSRELAREDEVFVFHRISDPEREEYQISFRTDGKLKICSINNTFRFCDNFEKTYKNDKISRLFGEFLDSVKPEIAHFGHLTCLSTTLIEEARKRRIPIIFTLHDFWLFCQLGQLLKRDLVLCKGPKDSECARCLAPQLALDGNITRIGKLLKRKVHSLQKAGYLEKIQKSIYTQYAKIFYLFQGSARAQIQKRTEHIREMCSLVDLFVAPSKFLLQKFLEFGIPQDKIKYYDYGFDTTLFWDFSKVRSTRLRFGYIGTLIPSKGVHVLLEAFDKIELENIELRIHGKVVPYHDGYENYQEYLRSVSKRGRVKWNGEYDNRNIAKILAEIDILVVPSIWYENSPLTIHEAFMGQTPVITSNIGGMAELVQNGKNGLLFRVGDSNDLERKMKRFIEDPTLLERLQDNIRSVIPIQRHALEMRRLYRSLIENSKYSCSPTANSLLPKGCSI